MIRQKIVLPDYDDWTIYAYYAVTYYAVDEIMGKLRMIDCDRKSLRRAYKNLSKGELDSGLCYSNYYKRRTVLVIALTSCAAEFFNSLHHELQHFEGHIGEAYNLDPKGEEIAYLSGDVAMEMFPKIKHLICDCCRKEGNYES